MTSLSVLSELPITDAQTKLFGAMLPERVLEEVLEAGYAAIKEDQSLIDDLFHKLDKKSLDDIKGYYDTHSVAVRQNFPRDDIIFPIVTVVNGDDNENVDLDMLGDFMNSGFDAGFTQNEQILGHGVSSTFNIYCLAGKDSNAALWLYYLAKAIFMVNAKVLFAHGLHNVVMRGRDITLREDLFPEFTFARVLTLSCDNYFSIKATERVANKLTVALFDKDEETGIKTQLNVEDP